MFGWLNSYRKRKLLGLKRIKVNGMRFIIRRVNPIMDFPAARVPQLFTDSPSIKMAEQSKSLTPLQIDNIRQTVLAYIQAGVVEPRLVPVGKGENRGKEPGITAEDLFRDPSMGVKLYYKILANSLNVFSDTEGLFFSIRRRLLLFISLRVSMAANLLMWWRATVNPPPLKDNSSTSSSSA